VRFVNAEENRGLMNLIVHVSPYEETYSGEAYTLLLLLSVLCLTRQFLYCYFTLGQDP